MPCSFFGTEYGVKYKNNTPGKTYVRLPGVLYVSKN